MKTTNRPADTAHEKTCTQAIAAVVDELNARSFIQKWRISISDLTDHEEVRINSVVIGVVADLPERIYVGANTNHILVLDTAGKHLDTIELDESDGVKDLTIVDVTDDRHEGNELVVQTNNDSVLFFGINAKGEYQKLQYQINYSTSTITSVFALALEEAERPIYIGDSNGAVFKTSYDGLKLDKDKQSVIPEPEKLGGEIVAAITGSQKLLNGAFGLVVGYENGVILVLDETNACVTKMDIDKEIENIYLIEKNQNLVVTTDDYHVFHFSIVDGALVNNWNRNIGESISTVIADPRADSAIEFLVLSEDRGTISCFGKGGDLLMTGDPSFEGTSGAIYGQDIIIASREGELAQFAIMAAQDVARLRGTLFDSYASICRVRRGDAFCEFFNAEFDSEERAAYFEEFLITRLRHDADSKIIGNLKRLFQDKKYNTDVARGLICKISSSSRLKEAFLRSPKLSTVCADIIDHQLVVDAARSATNLVKKAEACLVDDPVRYVELMSKIHVERLDKVWVNKISEDDDVVAIQYYHNPHNPNVLDLLVATRKGKLLLLDKKSGQVIWSFALDVGDGQITSIAVADLCNDGQMEIVVGLENAQNSILIFCAEKNKFNSASNEISLDWRAGCTPSETFKLFMTRCRISGMDFNAIHKVRSFDFDHDGVQDLVISSENSRFEIFYFDKERRDRIVPRTKAVAVNNDDILVFDMTRTADGRILLHTGSASGNIEQHAYDGTRFATTDRSFTERDARITDIRLADLEDETVVLFSSEDNFIYCLDSALEYKWSFKTGGDVKSIGVSEIDGQKLILSISDDGYLYALDSCGNKKWDYPFLSPLDCLFVHESDIVVADSDGSIYLLHLENTDAIAEKMDKDLHDVAIDLVALLDNPAPYVRVYAIRKLLQTEPGPAIVAKIVTKLHDDSEFTVVVRSETVRLLTAYSRAHGLSESAGAALVSALEDGSKAVRLEGVKSFFELIEQHLARQIDLGALFIQVTRDKDLWVKEYLAGALDRIPNDGALAHAKWEALLSLLTLNRDEEWVLNEAVNSIGHFLSDVTDAGLLLKVLGELFNNGMEEDTLARVRKALAPSCALCLFDVYYQVIFGDLATIGSALQLFDSNSACAPNARAFENVVGKVRACVALAEQVNIDEIIGDGLLERLGAYWKDSPLSLADVIKNLKEYQRENNIADKIVYLNYTADSIAGLAGVMGDVAVADRALFELAIEGHLGNLISSTSRSLLDDVYLDIMLDSREVTVNETWCADINFNIVNNGYRPIEDIEINVKQSRQFEVLADIGMVGELVRSQTKKAFFRICAKTLGPVDVFLDVTYKGSLKASQELIRVHLNEGSQRAWAAIDNPYTAGIPIENDDIFVGRESLIEEIVSALQKDPVFVMGHRRMGKTSLIKFVQRHYLTSDSYVSVFVSAEKLVFSSMNEFLFSFCRTIADDLVRARVITVAQKNEYTAAIRVNGLVDFGVFFDDILLEVSLAGKTLALIIDEYPIIHEAVEDGRVDAQFIANLRGYMQNNSREFKMIYSGASSLKYLKSQYSSNLMGVGKSLEVSFLDEADVRKLIERPLRGMMTFDEPAFQYLMEITNGQPFLVQVSLSYLVDRLNREKKSSMVFRDAVEDSVAHLLEQVPHLQDDWNNRVYSKDLKWSAHEEKIARVYKQLIVTAITDNWKKARNGLKREDLYALLEGAMSDFHTMSRSIFDETISILAGTDDILSESNGLCRMKVGLFREWVIRKMGLSFSSTLIEAKNTLSA